MAKRRKSRTNAQKTAGRDLTVITRGLPRLRPIAVPRSRFDLRQVEDRRTFNPSRRSARRLSRPHHTLVVTPSSRRRRGAAQVTTKSPGLSTSALPSSVSFGDPRRVVICIRRKTRREMMFASGNAGRRVRTMRRRRRNAFSSISCR